MHMKLSTLQVGDKFSFKEGQVVFYNTRYAKSNSGSIPAELNNPEVYIFEVIELGFNNKKKLTSLLCISHTKQEYRFKIAGVYSDFKQITDSEVIKLNNSL